ncbi:Foot protein 1 variant 1 [Labeo rohita]|uniref:Foot protein 1 variant 1 n=1 Tax=Labeo rohita TaxID=84645 RepID=A0ABQ8MCB4_LABRO|nr:Foot protein 1 variant 1 [Labeo rohita]
MSHVNPTSHLARCSFCLQNFNFDVIHKPGSRNKVPDALSRNPLTDDVPPMDLLPDYSVIGGLDLRTLSSVTLTDQSHVRQLQLDDPITGDLLPKMEVALQRNSDEENCSQYSIHNGLLCFNDPKPACGIHPLKCLKLYAPMSPRDNQDIGPTETFFWPKMASEWVEIVEVREATAQVAASKLLKHRLTTVYHPQTNSTERVNRTLKTAIGAYVDDKHTTWDFLSSRLLESRRVYVRTLKVRSQNVPLSQCANAEFSFASNMTHNAFHYNNYDSDKRVLLLLCAAEINHTLITANENINLRLKLHALWCVGSPFTVGVTEEERNNVVMMATKFSQPRTPGHSAIMITTPVLKHDREMVAALERAQVMAVTVEHVHKMAPTAEHSSKVTAGLHRPSQAIADLREPSEVTASLHKPSQATAGLSEPSQVTAVVPGSSLVSPGRPESSHVSACLHKPSQATANLHEPSQVTADLHEPSQVTAVLYEPSQVTVDLHEPGQVTADLHEPSQVIAVVPESSHVPAGHPESSHVSAGRPEPRHVSSDHPEPRHISSDRPEPRHVSSDRPEPRHASSDTPEPRHILSDTPSSQPIMKASVLDPPLVSVRAASIRVASVCLNPTIKEVLPSAAALPLMAIAIWCVWAAHCAPEVSSVHKSAPDVSSVHKSAPEVSSVHKSAPEVSSVHKSAPEVLSVHESAPEISSVHKSAPEVSSVHKSAFEALSDRESVLVPPEVAVLAADPPNGAADTTIESPEVAAYAAEPLEMAASSPASSATVMPAAVSPGVAVPNDPHLASILKPSPEPTTEAIYELSPCPVPAMFGLSSPAITATKAANELLACPVTAKVVINKLSAHPVTATKAANELSARPVTATQAANVPVHDAGPSCSALEGSCASCSALEGVCFACSALEGICFACSTLEGVCSTALEGSCSVCSAVGIFGFISSVMVVPRSPCSAGTASVPRSSTLTWSSFPRLAPPLLHRSPGLFVKNVWKPLFGGGYVTNLAGDLRSAHH